MAEAAGPLILRFPGGLDNLSRESDLPEGMLRTAENVDIANAGNAICRKGLRLVTSGACHSFYAHPNGNFALVVKDGVLGRLDWDETFTALVTLDKNVDVRYAELNSSVYWTTPYQVGMVTSTGTLSAWGLNTPPTLVASATSGGLPKGRYQVTQTAIRSDGVESGAPEPVVVNCTDPDQKYGILVTTPSGSSTFNIYMTPANGRREELRLAATLSAGVTGVLASLPTGRPLRSLNAVKPFPGQAIAAYRGRLWIADSTTLWFTSEYSPHWLFPATGYFQVDSEITMLAAAEDGLYVGTAHSIWYLQGGNPKEMTLRPVSSVGAVSGSGQGQMDYDLFSGPGGIPTRQCAWLDNDGFLCVGKPGGIIVRPTRERYTYGQQSSASIAFRRYEGLRQCLVAGYETEDAPSYIATTIPSSTINENGTSL